MKKTAIVSLIIANLIPIIGIFFGGWNIFSLLFFYWLESAVVGFYNIAKMAMIRRGGGGTRARPSQKLSGILFFIVHYSVFMAGHGLFIFELFSPVDIDPKLIILASVSLVASHGVSFFVNFIGNREYTQTTISQQMIAPYRRIMVMHLSIILCGFLINLLAFQQLTLVMLVILKISIDAVYHYQEHKNMGTYGQGASDGASGDELANDAGRTLPSD